ncbi:hypothetical protein CC80DRAFT_497415 [Byssothecium circinans]|uniref:Uncharacterized protein n=1 Tax=Byssothecium circinans TaxID=147558 RepID=A0A6A5TB79_9PLEO|nr:hypothetical protein CC80DRAFT_497415 [Byssothecium circinans]
MPPDLNSLPPSPSPSSTPRISSTPNPPSTTTMSHSPTASHTPPHSLAAAATMNAGIQNEDLRRQSSGSMRREVERARRRSSIRMNLNFNDPSVPAPGEMQRSPSSRSRTGMFGGSPHHERAPSLGELHQELEYEQEGQVNRLLNMIRTQQAQIQSLQNQPPSASTSAVVDDSTPTSERSMSLSHTPSASIPHRSNSPFALTPNPRANMSRQSSLADRSRGSSHTGSPALRPVSSHGHGYGHDSHEFLPAPAAAAASLHTRDESAFYQAETQMLTRENQMLKLRIRELERQLAETHPNSSVTRSPILSSNLHTSPPHSRRPTHADEGAGAGSGAGAGTG